jgi:hypothetical protein
MSMGLIYTSITLFALAAIIGLYLLTFVWQKKETPKTIAILHGALAASALILLIMHTVNTGADLIQAIVLFVIAALGGIVLFIRDITGKSLPKALAILHGLLAVSGFVFLLVHTVNK